MSKEKNYPLDRSDPQQPKPVNGLDTDILNLVHSEMKAHPEALSRPIIDAAIKNYLDAQLRENLDETEDQTTDKKELWQDLLDREQNFFNGIDPSTIEENTYYLQLEDLALVIEADIQKLRGIPPIQMLKKLIFARVYNFVLSKNGNYRLFANNTDIYSDALDVCFFVSLCGFLYETKRIGGLSISEFIRIHSPTGFSQKGNPNYFDRKRHKKESEIGDKLTQEETRFRQSRYRILKGRPVYHESQEWSGMRWVSGHEWLLQFYIDKKYDPKPSKEKERIKDTFKRIRNLYSDINKAINSKMDEEYLKRLDTAAEKFCSKLDKLQYERFLELGKFCLDHINQDKTCYGINLYRFEKELQLYRITSDVNQLLNCSHEAQKYRIIALAARMVNIIFPKLYESFSSLPDITHTFIDMGHYREFFPDLPLV